MAFHNKNPKGDYRAKEMTDDGRQVSTMRRIGILTSAGGCTDLNAVTRAVVKTAHEIHEAEVVGMSDGFLGLLPDGTRRQLTVDDVKGIVARGVTALGTAQAIHQATSSI